MAGRAERLGRAALENYSTTPLFNTKAVVRQTGVPAPTLRAWERRYGVLTPHRGENDYRLYSERDIAIIRWLREQVENGLSISQAIALLRTLTQTEPASLVSGQGPVPGSLSRAEESIGQERAGAPPGAVATRSARPGSSLTEVLQSLHQASTLMDEAAASSALAHAFAMLPLEQVIDQIIEPLLAQVGDNWANGRISVTAEHFISTLIRSQLAALYRSEPTPTSGPLILVGCAPGELHEIGPLILALMLRRQRAGLRVTYLGQNIEPTHLIESTQILHPAVVCLSATLPEHAQAIADIAQKLGTLPPMQRPALVFGGRAFLVEPELRTHINGTYLNKSAIDAASKIPALCFAQPERRSAI